MSEKAKKPEAEEVPPAPETEAEATDFEKGLWVEATSEQEHPPIGLPVWYAVPGGDPDVRLGTWDGQVYNETSTGRASLDAEVTGYKELYSEAPTDPGFALPEPAPEETPASTA